MRKIDAFGSALIIFGLGILTGYGLYMFIRASDVPVILRLGVTVLFAGILIIILSLVRERLIDIKKGG
jgi:hypothetical protein